MISVNGPGVQRKPRAASPWGRRGGGGGWVRGGVGVGAAEMRRYGGNVCLHGDAASSGREFLYSYPPVRSSRVRALSRVSRVKRTRLAVAFLLLQLKIVRLF